MATDVSDGVHRELQVLKDLGAELVESVDPQYPDDPAIPNMAFSFQDSLAEIIPFHMPEVLSWKTADGTKYETVFGTTLTKLAHPLPFNIGFWAGPGEEATILKVASSYEAATKHRRAPPGFGPVKGEPGF